MGEVYRARDTRLDREVAIKILPKDQTSPDRMKRFIGEARAAARLNHPNIIAIYDIAEAGGIHPLLPGRRQRVGKIESGRLVIHPDRPVASGPVDLLQQCPVERHTFGRQRRGAVEIGHQALIGLP